MDNLVDARMIEYNVVLKLVKSMEYAYTCMYVYIYIIQQVCPE